MRKSAARVALVVAVALTLGAGPAWAAPRDAAPSNWRTVSTASYTAKVPNATWKAKQDKQTIVITSTKGQVVQFVYVTDLPYVISAKEVVDEIIDDGGLDAQAVKNVVITKTSPLDTSTPGVERITVDWKGVRVKGGVPVKGQIIADAFDIDGVPAVEAWAFAAPATSWGKSVSTLYVIGDNITVKG